MHRPFFSLVIMLEIIAVSLLFVRSAYPQTGVPALDTASVTAHGCGWWWHGKSGQEVRRNCVAVYRAIQNRCVWRPAENAVIDRSIPWTVADDTTLAPTLVSTGYDIAYDFAMFEGRFEDVAQSHVDIDGGWAAIESPAPVHYYDDYNCCLDSGFNRWIDQNPHSNTLSQVSDSAWGDCEAYSLEEANASSDEIDAACDAKLALEHIQAAFAQSLATANTVWQSYVAPFAQPDEFALSDADAKLAWEHVHRAVTRTVEVMEIALNSSWKPFSCHWLVIESKNWSIEELVAQKPTFPVASTVSLSDGQQIALLTQAAATLDQMGFYLREAAQQLRYMAADRIVSKGSSRRIAREGNR